MLTLCPRPVSALRRALARAGGRVATGPAAFLAAGLIDVLAVLRHVARQRMRA